MDEAQRNLRESLLDAETRNFILCDWVRTDHKLRSTSSTLNRWEGVMPLIGSEVGAFGCVGVVCDHGFHEYEGKFYHCLWVKFRSGCVKVIQSEVEEVTEEKKTAQQIEFGKRLEAAGKKVEKQRRERRAKSVRGSHLIDDMLNSVSDNLTIDRKSGWYKITGKQPKKTVYLAIKGGKVHLSGFTIDNIAVNSITDEQAKKRHLGRVRGEIDFDHSDSVVMEALSLSLKELE